MPKIDYCNDRTNKVRGRTFGIVTAVSVAFPVLAFGAEKGAYNENLSGYYAREGNGGSPAEAAGNNIYIRFFADRWLGMLFLPYPYAESVDKAAIARVFDAARAQTLPTVPTCAGPLANSTRKPHCTSKDMATSRIASFSNAGRWRPAPSDSAMATWS